MLWGLQSNLGGDTLQQLIEGCKATGTPYIGLTCIPFSFGPLPDLPTDVPTIFWGSVGFIKPIWESKKWTPGVILNDNFDYRVWSKKWGNYCLNSDAQVTTLEEFIKQDHPDDSFHFLRPCADDKSFTGLVIEFREVKDWMNGVIGANQEQFSKIPIIVSEPVGIEYEWRLYMLNGKPISASQYKKGFKSLRASGAPQEVLDFGEKMAALWCPAELFCLDIAQSGDGLYVIEMGTFHSCGMYEADVPKIISEINNYFEKSGE